MGDIKLFQITDGHVQQLTGQSVAVEKSLQILIEAHLEPLLGVRFLGSEYSTGKLHGGRIDTLGIDENGFPVIIEYKRSVNETVINQGLFYLNWLLDHRGEFELLVLKTFGSGVSESIDWSSPRLCIAGDFTKYDEHAVQQINRNIELIRYRRYGQDLLLLELVNAVAAHPAAETSEGDEGKSKYVGKTVSEYLEGSPETLKDLYYELDAFITALDDDIQKKTLKNYFAYKRIKNLACVELHPTAHQVYAYVRVDPSTITLEDGFTRDMREIGHYGTGDLEIRIGDREELEKAKPLIVKSYEAS